MLIPNEQVNIINTSSVMIIFILLFLLTKCNLLYLAHRELAPINYLALNLTQRVTLEYAE